MSDQLLALAGIQRAGHALDMARGLLVGEGAGPRAKAFIEMARLTALERFPENLVPAMQRSNLEMVVKASAHNTNDEVWAGPDAQALARGFIASVSEPDVLTAISRYARVLEKANYRVLIASGSVGDMRTEGAPKIVRRLDLTLGGDDQYRKATSMVVVTHELLSKITNAGQKLFESELEKAVVRATNAAVIASLVDSSTITVAAGTDPLASLRAGLMAAGPSSGYVVSAPATWVAWLSTHEANRGGMGVRGGVFSPGVEVVALDDATSMHVIPAERLTYWDGGIELRSSGEATVDMRDSPEAVGEKVSLWQVNAYGLLVERLWRIDGDTSGVVEVA